MNSLKINFGRGGAEMKFDETVAEFDATIQAALVNIATDRGSATAHPARGTNLLREAVSGRLVGEQAAQHAVNFAAIDTLFFVRENEPIDSGEKLTEIVTEPVQLSVGAMRLRLQFRGGNGTVKGVINDLVTNV